MSTVENNYALLLAIISQLQEQNGVRGINWNIVAEQIGVPTGNAASMRWTRLRQSLNNSNFPKPTPGPRAPRGSRVSAEPAKPRKRATKKAGDLKKAADEKVKMEDQPGEVEAKDKIEPVSDDDDAAVSPKVTGGEDLKIMDEPVKYKVEMEPLIHDEVMESLEDVAFYSSETEEDKYDGSSDEEDA